MSSLDLIPEYQRLRQTAGPDHFRPDRSHRQVLRAVDAYNRARWHGRWHRLLAWLRGRPSKLENLAQSAPPGSVAASRATGLHLVPLNLIQGSEAKENEFDRAFFPRNERSRDRWVSIALARAGGAGLPPVKLILVDDGCNPLYFVRDGHHRISVARSYGQQEIEAEVTIWHLHPRTVTQTRTQQWPVGRTRLANVSTQGCA
jgi:hypothetical protein